MPQRLEPRLDVLPAAQRRLWPSLSPAARLGLVLYGGTAIALHLGHRTSVDFDFFGAGALDKKAIRSDFDFLPGATVLQDTPIGLSAFKQMFHGEPAAVLRAIGFFGDGDLRNVGEADREILRVARDRVGALPAVRLRPGLVPADG